MVVGSLLGGAVGGATISIVIRAIDNYSKEFRKVERGLKKQQGVFKKLGTFLKKTGIGYGLVAGAAAGFGIAAVKAALQSERATQQFELALGDLASTMRNELRRASNGMVSDFKLIDAANRALALGIDKNQLVPLMEVAVARSKVFGRSVTEAFNDISIGIGRQSRLILDNLGIILNLEKTYEEYAETLGKTSEALSESEKKQALVVAIIKDTQPLLAAQAFLIETNTEKLQRLNAQWSNLVENVGLWALGVADSVNINKILQQQFADFVDVSVEVEGAFEQTGQAVLDLGNQMRASQDRAKGLLDSLRDLSNVVLFGESEKNIEIAQKEFDIAQKKLEVKRLERFEENAPGAFGAEQERRQLEKLEDELEILRLERDADFTSVKNLERAKSEAFVNEQSGIIQTLDEFLISQAKKQEAFFEEKKIGKELEDQQKSLGQVIIDGGFVTQEQWEKFKEPSYLAEEDAIQRVMNKTGELIRLYEEAGRKRALAGVDIAPFEPSKGKAVLTAIGNVLEGIGGGGIPAGRGITGVVGVGDAIIRPNGQIIETDPRDTIIATKNPMGQSINIIFNDANIQGIDAEDVSRALNDELRNKISII